MPFPADLSDQRVVILGGTSGLGLATARAAAAAGAAVTVVSSREARVDAALGQLPDSAEGRVADLLDEAAVAGLFAELGAFDHLVYTAGEAIQLGLVADTPTDTIRNAFQLRVFGAYAAVKHAAPHLRATGSITLTGGTAAARPQAGWAAGALICAGMEGLTRTLAVELAPVRVNLVAPGVIRTDLWRDIPETERENMYASIAATLPAGRVGEAGDVAQSYLYAMTNRFATGTVIAVDGGTLLV